MIGAPHPPYAEFLGGPRDGEHAPISPFVPPPAEVRCGPVHAQGPWRYVWAGTRTHAGVSEVLCHVVYEWKAE